MAVVTKIFTIGHGALTLEEFLRRLQMHHIRARADVRRFPASKRHPHFSRAALSGALKQREINYHWLGGLLSHVEAESGTTISIPFLMECWITGSLDGWSDGWLD